MEWLDSYLKGRKTILVPRFTRYTLATESIRFSRTRGLSKYIRPEGILCSNLFVR